MGKTNCGCGCMNKEKKETNQGKPDQKEKK